MDKNPISTPAAALEAALLWWRDAGVDSDFTDEPQHWLAKPGAEDEAPLLAKGPAAKRVEKTPEIPPLGGAREGWPTDLPAFGAWWSELPDLPGAGLAVAPRGQAQAELMILAPMPEPEDRETLLSARHGELAVNMLRAMQIEADHAYLAAALPRHASHPDWAGLAARGLGAILLHHIELAAPRRLLVLGREMLPLFGHDPAQGAASTQQIALEGLSVPVLVARGPEALLSEPRFRRALWHGWLGWTEENT